MKRVNGCVVVFLGLAVCGCTRSPQARRDKYTATGEQFLQKKDYSRAILQFKNAVQAMPNDPDVYYRLGMAYLAAQDLRPAFLAFRKTIEFNPKHPGALLRMAQLMAKGDESMTREAEGRLQSLLENSSGTPEVLNTLAFTELRLGETNNAIRNLEQALAQSPHELDSSILLARAKLTKGDVIGAEEILKNACAGAPKSADARLILGRFYVFQKRVTQAETEFRKAVQIDPQNGAALMDLASLQNGLGRNQEAEENFKRLSGLGDKAYKPMYAFFLFQNSRRDQAILEFEKLFQEDPQDRVARTRMIAAYVAVNRRADAERALAEALRKNAKDSDALMQRGEMFLSAGKYDQAEADLNKVIQMNPSVAEVHYLLAKLHQSRGSDLSYRQELSKVLELNSHLMAVRLELAQALLAGKSISAAQDVLNGAPGSQKQTAPYIAQRNWVLWAGNDLAEMRRGIDLGLSRERTTDLLIQDGLWKLKAGNPSGARVSLEEALRIDSSDLRALAALGQTYTAQKQSSAALEKVKEYAAKQPKSAPVQEFLGTLLVASGNGGQARAAFEAAKAADPSFDKAILSLVQLDALEGKLDDARTKLQGLVESPKASTRARLWLANIEEHKGNHTAAIEHFRKVVEADPKNAMALNNLAYVIAEHGKQPDQALKFAERANEVEPGNADYEDTLGWVLYRKGLYLPALTYLKRAGSKSSDAVPKYHLAMAYAKVGNYKEAQGMLGIALKLNPKAPEAKMALEIVGQKAVK